MRPYNDPPVGERLPSRVIQSRLNIGKDESFTKELLTTIPRRFSLSELEENEDILDPMQDKIEELVALLGTFDPNTEVGKTQPDSLKRINKLITSHFVRSFGNGAFAMANADVMADNIWTKFQKVATQIYNVNELVPDNGDALIVEICNLCLIGVARAIAKAQG